MNKRHPLARTPAGYMARGLAVDPISEVALVFGPIDGRIGGWVYDHIGGDAMMRLSTPAIESVCARPSSERAASTTVALD
jgi:hypothetical protein